MLLWSKPSAGGKTRPYLLVKYNYRTMEGSQRIICKIFLNVPEHFKSELTFLHLISLPLHCRYCTVHLTALHCTVVHCTALHCTDCDGRNDCDGKDGCDGRNKCDGRDEGDNRDECDGRFGCDGRDECDCRESMMVRQV